MSSMKHEKRLQLIKEEQDRHEVLMTLQKGFQVADVFINRQYLDDFSSAEILDLNRRNIQSSQKLRIFNKKCINMQNCGENMHFCQKS